MVWIELSACEIHFGASTKFLDYRVYVRYDMQAQDETSHSSFIHRASIGDRELYVWVFECLGAPAISASYFSVC